MSDLALTITDDSPLNDDAVRALAVLLVDLAEAVEGTQEMKTTGGIDRSC